MPAETLHTAPNESAAAPSEERTRKFGEPTGERGTVWTSDQYEQENGPQKRYGKYGVGDGAGGVQFDNPNNYFHDAGASEVAASQAFTPEAFAEESKGPELAADQPRRARTNPDTGAIEKLVKYDNGEFAWVPESEAPVREKSTGEQQASPEVAEATAKTELHGDILKTVVPVIDGLEASNEKQDEKIDTLQKLIDEQKQQIADLTARLEAFAKLMEDQSKASPDAEVIDDDIIDAEVVDEPERTGKDAPLVEPIEDIGTLKVIQPAIEAAPVRKELEAAPVRKELEAKKEEEPGDLEIIIPAELKAALDQARDRYAERTAKGRESYIGHFLEGDSWLSKKLSKIGFVKNIAEKVNASKDAEHRQAREDYKQAVHEIQQYIYDKSLEADPDDPEAVKEGLHEAGAYAMKSEADFQLKVAALQMESSGATNKFINWWVQQEGLGGKGRIKKALVIAAGGAAAGLIAGGLAVPIAGIAAGIAAGAGTGLYVTKKRASGITEKGGTTTLAQAQGEAEISRKSQYAKEQLDSGNAVSIDEITKITEERTATEKERNLRRVKAAASVAGLGATGGAAAGGAIREAVLNAFSAEAPAPEVVEPTPEAPAPTPEAPVAPELQGLNFDVQSGSGYTQELMEFAQANGHALTPDQSWQLHQDLMNQFGQDYININGGGNDIYVDGNDVRLTAPGSATWNDGVGQFVQQWMMDRSLW